MGPEPWQTLHRWVGSSLDPSAACSPGGYWDRACTFLLMDGGGGTRREVRDICRMLSGQRVSAGNKSPFVRIPWSWASGLNNEWLMWGELSTSPSVKKGHKPTSTESWRGCRSC